MISITQIFSEATLNALGWTILHSLWQGAFFAILLGILLVLMRKFTAQSRYIIAVAILGLFLCSSVATFSVIYENDKSVTQISTSFEDELENDSYTLEAESAANNLPIEDTEGDIAFLEDERVEKSQDGLFASVLNGAQYFKKHFPLMVTLWLLGVMILLLRFLGSLAFIQRLKHYKTALFPEEWQHKLEELKIALEIRKKVKLLSSKVAVTPLAIGIIKPAIIMPSKILTTLSEEQIEAILIHELAHIKRNDFAVNILQSLVEILFFYHPAVWWMSEAIRSERENCCDDIAISMTGDTYDYASALVQLQEKRVSGSVPNLAMAILGTKYSFKHRIKRLFDNPSTFADFKEGFVTAIILVVGFMAITFNSWGSKSMIDLQKDQITETLGDILVPADSSGEETGSEEDQYNTDELEVYFTEKNGTEHKIVINRAADTDESTDNDDLQLLLDAIDDNNYEMVKFILDKGVNVNAQTNGGWTALLAAIDEGSIKMVELLVSRGAKVTHETNKGWTPIMEAIDEGMVEIVNLLIDKGADLNSLQPSYTPLMKAIDEGDVAIVKTLLNKGADINKANDRGWSALFEAADEGNLEILMLLVEKGADINQKYGNGRTILMECIDSGDLGLVKFLADRGADISSPQPNYTPLLEAIDDGEVNIVKYLLDKGVDPNQTNNHGWSPLMEAADEGQIEIAQVLLEKGADINQKYRNGYTVFMEAIDNGNLEFIKFMMSKGADLNSPQPNLTPLMEAIDEGHYQVVKYLIDMGADVNKANNQGWTPLMEAADEGYLNIIKLLIEKGANPDYRNSNNWGLLLEAIDEGQIEIVRYLLDNGADVNDTTGPVTPLLEAIDEGNYQMVKLLIEKGANVNQSRDDKWTPLMEAADEGQINIARLLMMNGADPNVQNDAGWNFLMESIDEGHLEMVKLAVEKGVKVNTFYNEMSPLMEAIDEGQFDIVKFLVQNGVNVNAQNEDGYHALIEAADEHHLDIAKFLVQKGANVNLATNSGWTALFEAIDEGDKRMVEFLLSKKADVNKRAEVASGRFIIHNGKEVVYFEGNRAVRINDGANKVGWEGKWTPLFEAVQEEKIEIAKMLIAKGANVNETIGMVRYLQESNNAENWDGYTPLMEAIRQNNVAMAQLLMDKGARVSTKLENGRNMLEIAKELGDDKMIKFIEGKFRQ